MKTREKSFFLLKLIVECEGYFKIILKLLKISIFLCSFFGKDKDCLATVLEVVELGVSGTKSVGKPGEPIKMKDEKELKPASMRVRDAADALLTIILEQVRNFSS